MTSTTVAVRESGSARPATAAWGPIVPAADRADAVAPAGQRRFAKPAVGRNASDDDILGIGTSATRLPKRSAADGTQDSGGDQDALDAQLAFDFDAGSEREAEAEARGENIDGEPESLRAIFDANPELQKDREDANAYRESFATPADARDATEMLSDLNRMDALFYSRRPEDHAELARSIASLDPAAFDSLARAMGAQAAMAKRATGSATADGRASSSVANREAGEVEGSSHWAGETNQQQVPRPTGSPGTQTSRRSQDGLARDDNAMVLGGPTAAQTDFFHATNAAAVETVLDAIETQVERLLPDGVSKNARNRVVGEIYRELDGTLRSNRQLGQQMRDAFRSGSLDAEHQRAIVSMIAGRARQALPGVAKRVLSEWTSTVVAANQDRRARQRAAERRVDIAGSRGGDGEGHRATSPRDLDYKRMSDADILNL